MLQISRLNMFKSHFYYRAYIIKAAAYHIHGAAALISQRERNMLFLSSPDDFSLS